MRSLTLYILALCLSFSLQAQNEVQIDNDHELGLVVDGYKKGIWKYFDQSGEMVLQIDYDQAKVLFVHRTASLFYLRDENHWTSSKVDKPPMFIGSPIEFDKIVNENMQYPDAARNAQRSGQVVVSFVVNKAGSTQDFEVVRDFGYGSGEEVIRVLQLVPDLWIPATKDDEIYETKFYISVVMSLDLDRDMQGTDASETVDDFGLPGHNLTPSVNFFKEYFFQFGQSSRNRIKKS